MKRYILVGLVMFGALTSTCFAEESNFADPFGNHNPYGNPYAVPQYSPPPEPENKGFDLEQAQPDGTHTLQHCQMFGGVMECF